MTNRPDIPERFEASRPAGTESTGPSFPAGDGGVAEKGDNRPRIAVRSLCAFVARSGDLDHRFTPAPSAEEGIAGHQAVASMRGADYRREVPVSGDIAGLRIGGRIDGIDADGPVLEEVKTFRGGIERVPENHRALAWAQLRCYGALYAAAEKLETVALRLVYYDVDERREHSDTETFSSDELSAWLEERAARYAQWLKGEQEHRTTRDAALTAMVFPFAQRHAGQRMLMRDAFRAFRDGGRLLAQAPTGTGKTMGTLFPALKALGAGHLDRVFWLTAKTSGRLAAREAIAALRDDDEPLPLRALELSARDTACEHPDKACHGQSCPLARGFFDRLPAAREQARSLRRLDLNALRGVAGAHGICPYYLGQEMARWADVVIGDVNHYFDRHALLHALTREQDWRAGLLVDEAHNLVARARAMYSASLAQGELHALQTKLPADARSALGRLDQALGRLEIDLPEGHSEPEAPPQQLRDAVTRAVSALGGHLAEDPARPDTELLGLYFNLLAFQQLCDIFGPHSLCELQRGRDTGLLANEQIGLAIHNVVPAPHLAPRLRDAAGVVAFSATLAPFDYFRQLLGFPEATTTLEAPSPFDPERLAVHRVTHIDTTWRGRTASARPIAALMARQFQQRPGNYLACFSSFTYMQDVADALATHHPEVPQRRQHAGMAQAERQAFIGDFRPDSPAIAFAVLGGVFAEGIDLPGERLIGAFVATLGLPPVSPLHDRMAEAIEGIFGADSGWRYTYLYPGLQKVVQAAGRVIRSADDAGCVYLIDPRYSRADVRALLPPAWEE
ncbi:ATP-dependent DNA helicase [Algiphilus aromaticivorans]|uniref:ATP-dependent DNA helicase n=1 Tax=Algiphilus aromaticivorans TaxID=382454 RepID=UPI000A076819|nr:ATP-dependent DNA helicase [Algiphilus aromaticivorans]